MEKSAMTDRGVAYEVYSQDATKRYKLIGVLPERRKDPSRITQESVIHWGEAYFRKKLDTTHIFSIQIRKDQKTGRVYRTTPSFIT